MAGWKKYLFVALICMLVLGLMLYGDIGQTNTGGTGRISDFGTATVNDRVNKKIVELGAGQVSDIVNLFNVTAVTPIINPQVSHADGVTTEEYISSYLYFNNAYTREHYAASPRFVEEWINNRVWLGRERLVNPAEPERNSLRAARAGELGTNVQAIEDFVRRGTAGMTKQNQFMASVTQTNRADLALLYLISHERPRIRYMEFPAQDYLTQAQTAVADDEEGLKKEYEADKLKKRTQQGETGQSMSRPLKLQFDVFYIEQDAFFDAEAKKIGKDGTLKEYNKQRNDYETNHQDSILTKKKAWTIFEKYVPHDPKVKPLVVDPAWKDLKDDAFLSPEDAVLDYIKYVEMIPRELVGRSAATIREFAAKYNADLLGAKPEDRAEFATGFLARLHAADPAGYEAKWQFVRYLRTDLASFKAFATAQQAQLSPATKTPYPLNTFFDQVINHQMLPEFQKQMSVPLSYTITFENGKELLSAKPGGSLVFQVHAVENLDPAAAVIPFDAPEAKQLLIDRLARTKAPELAKAAAEKTRKEWSDDPTKLPTDPQVLKEFIEPEGNPQQPAAAGDDRRQLAILRQFTSPTPLKGENMPDPEPVAAGELRGPISEPLEGADSSSETALNECYVIGFVAQYHEVADPVSRLTTDAGWRGGQEPRRLQMAMYGIPSYGYLGLTTKMLHQAVPDAFSTTVTKPKPTAAQ